MEEVLSQRLAGPLPGGSPGAAVTLRPMRCGEMLAPPGFLRREDGLPGRLRALGVGVDKSDQIWVPLPVFLVEHPTAGPILIDTGAPASAAHDVKAAFGRLGAAIYNVRMRPEDAVAARLRALEIDPLAIKTVVLTHLHLDHAGSIQEFPHAKFITTTRGWESANAPRGFVRGYVKRQFEHAFDYRLIDYDAPGINSFASFGRAFDLFGDGSITLVSTPGHSAGHQSVILRLSGREALICGDAAYTRQTIADGTPPLILHDVHNFKRSLREIRGYTQITPSALVIAGHDRDEWERLDAFYD
ncbi:MAG: N-acyl homoserine lactonase family protein [Thermoleophilia bacterium]|nr:N-acyl homoserine lactonase family protein [Thermoleophilia bacterium]